MAEPGKEACFMLLDVNETMEAHLADTKLALPSRSKELSDTLKANRTRSACTRTSEQPPTKSTKVPCSLSIRSACNPSPHLHFPAPE